MKGDGPGPHRRLASLRNGGGQIWSETSAAASIVPTPNFEISTRPNLAEAIAEPLNLSGVVAETWHMGAAIYRWAGQARP